MAFVPQQNVVYKICSGLDTDFVLDISGNPKHLNDAILYKWNNGDNQKFAFRPVGQGKYAIFCAKNNQTVQVEKGNKANGAKVVASHADKADNEFWQFIPCHDPHFKGKTAYYLKNFAGKALDVCQGKCKNEQSVISWDYNGNKNQVWIIEAVF